MLKGGEMLEVNKLDFITSSDFNQVDYYMFNIDYTTNDLTRNIKGTIGYGGNNRFRILETSPELSEHEKSDIALLLTDSKLFTYKSV
jgi:hypothetical protein